MPALGSVTEIEVWSCLLLFSLTLMYNAIASWSRSPDRNCSGCYVIARECFGTKRDKTWSRHKDFAWSLSHANLWQDENIGVWKGIRSNCFSLQKSHLASCCIWSQVWFTNMQFLCLTPWQERFECLMALRNIIGPLSVWTHWFILIVRYLPPLPKHLQTQN